MQFIKVKHDILVGSKIALAGSVVAYEDEMAEDMIKYGKGELHGGPAHLIFRHPEPDADPGTASEPEAAARPGPKAPPERQDLGAKIARAEKAVAPAQRQETF